MSVNGNSYTLYHVESIHMLRNSHGLDGGSIVKRSMRVGSRSVTTCGPLRRDAPPATSSDDQATRGFTVNTHRPKNDRKLFSSSLDTVVRVTPVDVIEFAGEGRVTAEAKSAEFAADRLACVAACRLFIHSCSA